MLLDAAQPPHRGSFHAVLYGLKACALRLRLLRRHDTTTALRAALSVCYGLKACALCLQR